MKYSQICAKMKRAGGLNNKDRKYTSEAAKQRER